MNNSKKIAGLLVFLMPLLVKAQSIEQPDGTESNEQQAVVSAGLTRITQEPVKYEFFNKITMQTGFGPEDSALGNPKEGFFSLRYEPTFIGYFPEQRWSKWQMFARAWVNYDSNGTGGELQEGNLHDNDLMQHSNFYMELRELYIKRNLIGDDPRFFGSVGRQRFYDKYGLWWDDSIESLRFDYSSTFAKGFLAVAQKFHNYNSDINKLDPRDKDIAYIFGQYAVRWNSGNWMGVRFLHENDYSDNNPQDPTDFKGWRVGAFFEGNNLNNKLISDYHVELVNLNGGTISTDQHLAILHNSTSGWFAFAEAGKEFGALRYSPRVALRGGISDKSANDADGFRLNRIESDRVINPETYSTRMLSSFIRLDMRNLMFYGAAFEMQPTARSSLGVRISNLQLRNPDGDLPVYLNSDFRQLRKTNMNNGMNFGREVGQIYDINYNWRMFPVARREKHVNLSVLANIGYLRAGRALVSGNDYQLSVGVILRY